MNITLGQYLACADKIHADIVSKSQVRPARKVKNKLYELESYIKQIQSVSCRIAQIYNACKYAYHKDNVLYREPSALSVLDTFPNKEDWTVLGRQTAPDHKLFVAPQIPINALAVNEAEEVPNAPLYWIRSLNQFATKINGVLLRGNIGNIYVRPHHGAQAPLTTVACKHANTCPTLLSGKRCSFYHDVRDLRILHAENKITDETMAMYITIYRNFSNASWIYTDATRTSKNEAMRFIGNRNTLKNDLDVARTRNLMWVDTYKSQAFHDLLVVMAINQAGLIKEYPLVPMVSDDYTGCDELVQKRE